MVAPIQLSASSTETDSLAATLTTNAGQTWQRNSGISFGSKSVPVFPFGTATQPQSVAEQLPPWAWIAGGILAVVLLVAAVRRK